MIELDNVRRYHEQALESVRDKSPKAWSNLILLHALYEGRREYSPTIAELANDLVGNDLKSNYGTELRLLDLYPLEQGSESYKATQDNTEIMDPSYKEPPELMPEYIPIVKALLDLVSRNSGTVSEAV